MARRQGLWPPYWVATRLIASARQQWVRFDGWCASQGLDPLDLPADRLCNLVYYWLTQNVNERRKDEIDRQLEKPPPGESLAAQEDESVWSPDAELAAFQSAASSASAR